VYAGGQDGKVAQLEEMGFDTLVCKETLKRSRGDVHTAIGLLLGCENQAIKHK